jgi:formate C-acetyltransferase
LPAGVSTFGREINWLPDRLASAHGSKIGTILAGNTSPTPGTDTEGATAVIKSYCKANLSEMVTGAALDLKITPSSLSGENGIAVLKSLILSFVRLGGYFLQIDTVNIDTLKKAQQTPGDYKTLSVRVSGWNARFITLTKEWQDMVIQRTEHDR